MKNGERVLTTLDRGARWTALGSAVHDAFEPVAAASIATLERGGRILVLGNGGSAATAAAVASAYVLAERWPRAPFRAADLTAETATWSGAAQGWGLDEAFLRTLEAHARSEDLLLLISPSGTPGSLVQAARWARAQGIATAAFLGGSGGALLGEVEFPVVVPGDDPFWIREVHLTLGHALVMAAEDHFLVPAHRALTLALQAEIGRTQGYRALSVALLDAGDEAGWEAINGLLADEQHHRARIAARLTEMGVVPASTGMDAIPPAVGVAAMASAPLTLPADLSQWRDAVRGWEAEEVSHYETLLAWPWIDRETRAVLEEILASERNHLHALEGKWMPA
jgi:D-sedoheptulose 7-phosphate isomerase